MVAPNLHNMQEHDIWNYYHFHQHLFFQLLPYSCRLQPFFVAFLILLSSCWQIWQEMEFQNETKISLILSYLSIPLFVCLRVFLFPTQWWILHALINSSHDTQYFKNKAKNDPFFLVIFFIKCVFQIVLHNQDPHFFISFTGISVITSIEYICIVIFSISFSLENIKDMNFLRMACFQWNKHPLIFVNRKKPWIAFIKANSKSHIMVFGLICLSESLRTHSSAFL